MFLRSLSLHTASSIAFLLVAACDSGSEQGVQEDSVYNPTCGEGQVLQSGRCVDAVYAVTRTVAFNSVGYHPDRVKQATLLVAVPEVRILDGSGNVVTSVTPGEAIRDSSLDQDVWIIDFSDVRTPGTYRLDFDGVDPTYGEALTFVVDENVYDRALETALLGITGQRCGTEVDIEFQGIAYHHPECHMRDGFLGKSEGDPNDPDSRDGTGGWHDAGDYGKYVVNGAFALGLMLQAWELLPGRLARPELQFQVPADGSLPLFLAEMKWELDWLFKMQRADGAVYHKLTALSFEGDVMPENDSSSRYYSPVGSAATADFVAVMAQAARIYQEYDEGFAADCLAAAQKSWTFLQNNPSLPPPNLEEFGTGAYQTGDSDDRVWAAAEIWQTTGDATALADFESRAATELMRVNFGWADLANLGYFTYLLSDREGRSEAKVTELTDSLRSIVASMVRNSTSDPFGIGYSGSPYWGINGVVLGSAANALVLHRLEPSAEYLDVASKQIDYGFGRNPLARSFVTGMGISPPQNPHHRPSVSDGIVPPWPGFLVGGPNLAEGRADWADYTDVASNYYVNEVALNWSAALIFALTADYSD